MAFATSNVYREGLGTMNGLCGTWTGSDGDLPGTVTGKGYALAAEFFTNNSVGPENVISPRISNSSGTWTVTVPYQQAVTAGNFLIRFK